MLLWLGFSGNGVAWADNTLFQYATLNGLIRGLYQGGMTFGELSRHGTLGLGTFHGLDGEMMMVDGVFHRLRVDGHRYPVAAEEKTPFAVVVDFAPEVRMPLPAGLELTALEKYLDSRLDGLNRFHAIRVDGVFRNVRVRSVPAQRPPYLPLTEVVKQQMVFDFPESSGVLVGFRIPDYAGGINAVGYHFHYITADRSAGGHLLALQTVSGEMGLDRLDRVNLVLPEGGEFGRGVLQTRPEEVGQVERQR